MPTFLHPSLQTLPLPNRGLGTLATAPLPKGTRLIADPPLLAADARTTLNEDVLRAHLVAAYAALAPAARQRIRSLAAAPAALERWSHVFREEEAAGRGWAGDDGGGAASAGRAADLGVEEKARVVAAWATNCFGVGEGEGGGRGWAAVVAPAAARLNHACAPNAVFAWNEARGAIVVQAIRDVGVGEEVTIAYVDGVAGREERRGKLRAAYGFVCGCWACADEEGDGVRVRIEEVKRWLREEGGEGEEARKMVVEGVELLERVGLVGVHLADFYEAAAVSTGDRQYLEEELRVRLYCLGDDHPRVHQLKQRLANH
ncbi:hypothetical protein GTA08_BOTSDO01601 [Neofusicoccum parvum]|uniref:Uncharacterized protein n=1 Tax=Neofusicoccum parvum TaxID=310453 RepID=A0ACB5SNM1_9PEZI|nr:hypothetical protein GTA08_BOTSDO01601 [Neofusicoccum parvum]